MKFQHKACITLGVTLSFAIGVFFLPQLNSVYADSGGTKFTPQISFCVSGSTELCNGSSCSGISRYIASMYQCGIGLAALLAFLMIFAAGFFWMLGGAKGAQEARKMIQNAILGLSIALASYVILWTINPNLTLFPDLNIKPVANIDFELISPEEEKTPITAARSDLSKNNTKYDALFKKYADAAGIDCTLVKAIAYQESGFTDAQPNCANAVGVMQVVAAPRMQADCHNKTQMVGIKGRPSVDQLLDSETNIRAGVQILHGYLKKPCPNSCKNNKTPFAGCVATTDFKNVTSSSGGAFTEGVLFALSAYNAGPCLGNLQSTNCSGKAKWQCPGELNETFKYSPAVLGHYKKMKENGWGC